jgi:hypothetical protein
MEFQVVSPFQFSTKTLYVYSHSAHLFLLDLKIEDRGNSIESAGIKPLFLDGTAHAIITM